jgi:hypothetical protein
MIRRILLATALTVAAVGVAVAPATPALANACPLGNECETNFYSDGTHTTLVGSIFVDCQGNTEQWGVRSGYQTSSRQPC